MNGKFAEARRRAHKSKAEREHRRAHAAPRTMRTEPLERREMLSGDAPNDVSSVAAYDGAWLEKLYVDTLGRRISTPEAQYWSAQLAAGAGPTDVVNAILSSREHRQTVVGEYYQEYLGREVDAAGLDFWVDVWQSHGAPELVQAALIGSGEFFQQQGGTVDGAIQGLYNAVLDRTAEESELAYWRNVIAQTPLTNVALGFLGSFENRLRSVHDWYADHLQRPIEEAGADYWARALGDGVSPMQIESALLTSSEYTGITLIDVAEFGAVGDGVTDDGPAIQRAFDAALAAPSAKVYFGKPRVSYFIDTTVTIPDATNLEIDARQAVFTESATDGVADLFASFIFLDGENIRWRGGQVRGSEYQGTSVTHGGVSTGYHAFFLANIDPPHSDIPLFMLFDRSTKVHIEGMDIRGKLRGLFLDHTTDVVVNQFDFAGILNGTFMKNFDRNADEEAESDVVRLNGGILLGGGSNILLKNLRANRFDETAWLGSLVISGSVIIDRGRGPYVGLPTDNLRIERFHVIRYHDHAVYLAATNVTVAHGTVIGGPEVREGAAIDFRGGSNKTVHHVVLLNVRSGIHLSLIIDDANVKISDCLIHGARKRAISVYLAGGVLDNLEISNCRITDFRSTVRPAIITGEAQHVTIVNNFISHAGRADAIHLGLADFATAGHQVVGNEIQGAQRAIVAKNISASVISNNFGALAGPITDDSTFMYFEDTTDSIIRDNRNLTPGQKVIVVPAHTVWQNNQLTGNIGQHVINSP